MKKDYSKSISNSIFHYTSRHTALEFILPYLRLRLNKLKNSNDPHEKFPIGFGSTNAPFREGKEWFEDYHRWEKNLNEKRVNSKVLCFSQDYFIEDEYWDGYNLARMWAQYGDNHSGVCLEIDKGIFIEENSGLFESEKIKFEKVSYSNKKGFWINFDLGINKTEDEFLNEILESYYQLLFFKKNLDWEAEHEMRVLSHFNCGETYLSIEKSLKRVIEGLNFPDGALPTLNYLIGSKVDCLQFANGKLEAWKLNHALFSLEKLRDQNDD